MNEEIKTTRLTPEEKRHILIILERARLRGLNENSK